VIARRGLPGSLDRLRHAGRRALLDGPMEKAWALYGEAERWSPETVRDRQWEWLRATMEEASRSSPFYQRRLRDAGWPALTRAQFDRVPPLRRDDLVRHAGEIGVPGRGGMHRSSGGSGGAPVVIPLDRDTYAWYVAGTWRGFRWWGVDPSDPVCLLLGQSSGSRLHGLLSRAKDWVLNWRRVPVDDRFDERAPEALDEIERVAPVMLYGYPSAIHRLALAAGARGRRSRLRLRVIVLTGEPAYAFQRDQIAGTFDCPVAEEYGSGELGSMAFECPHGALHVNAETVFLETVPDATSDGAGRILATHLRNRRFPLIRYDTGDVGTTGSQACPCGRGLPIVRVLGRDRDRLVGDGAAGFARPRVERLMSLLPAHLAGGVQVTQPAADAVVLRLSRMQARPEDAARAAAAGEDAFGPAWRVRIQEVDRLARIPSGKLPYFVGLAG